MEAQFTLGEKYYIRVENHGESTVYISVLRVDAAGKITLVSRGWERGLELSKHQPSRMFATCDFPLEGIVLGWPQSIPRPGSIKETFVFVITSDETDLTFLETSTPQDYLMAQARSSAAKGPETAARRTAMAYDVARIHYTFHSPAPGQDDDASQYVEDDEEEEDENGGDQTSQPPVKATGLPLPEQTKEWDDLTSDLQERATASKGFIDAAIRATKGIPPCVWVINEHDEEITVVVSKYRPNRMLGGGGLNVSTGGAGFNIETTVCNHLYAICFVC